MNAWKLSNVAEVVLAIVVVLLAGVDGNSTTIVVIGLNGAGTSDVVS